MTKEQLEEYYAGIDCECFARSQHECGCGNVDWTPKKVYEQQVTINELLGQIEILEKENRELKNQIADLKNPFIPTRKSGLYSVINES